MSLCNQSACAYSPATGCVSGCAANCRPRAAPIRLRAFPPRPQQPFPQQRRFAVPGQTRPAQKRPQGLRNLVRRVFMRNVPRPRNNLHLELAPHLRQRQRAVDVVDAGNEQQLGAWRAQKLGVKTRKPARPLTHAAEHEPPGTPPHAASSREVIHWLNRDCGDCLGWWWRWRSRWF